nr:Polynucleotidyl transferase, Ribonuclease H fold [Ipomoea batatas]
MGVSMNLAEWITWHLNTMNNDSICLLLITCWKIWDSRNQKVWRKFTTSPLTVAEEAKAFLEAWSRVHPHQRRRTQHSAPVKWEKPPTGWLKLNTDAAIGNQMRAHPRRRNTFGGKTLETRTVIEAVDWSSPPINRRSTVKPTLSPSQLSGDQSLPSINEGQSPCHVAKPLLSSAIFILGIRMSDSDRQNVSARDYDEGDEAVNGSSSPSTGGSTFNQIDEVEHVSPLAEENEGPLRPFAFTEDISSSGRGKSPRVVVSKTFPHLSPRTVEEVAASLARKGVPKKLRAPGRALDSEASSRPRALPAPGEASSSAPNPRQTSPSHAPAVTSSLDPHPTEAGQTATEPSATRKKMLFLNSEVVQQQKCLLTRAERTRALTDAAAKISSEVYDYLIFRTPESYKNANLEPPDYGREEKYEPVPLAVPATGGSLAEPSQGRRDPRMTLNSFQIGSIA